MHADTINIQMCYMGAQIQPYIYIYIYIYINPYPNTSMCVPVCREKKRGPGKLSSF